MMTEFGSSGVCNYYRFAGYYTDPEIDQYFCNARQCDFLIGRFTSRDPVFGSMKEPLTLHKYLYCINDPINAVDPTGKLCFASLSQGLLGRALLSGMTSGLTTGVYSSVRGQSFLKGFGAGMLNLGRRDLNF